MQGSAQSPARITTTGEAFVNGEIEKYLRVLQISGSTQLYPWSIRAFSPKELGELLPADTIHPWAAHYDFAPDTAGTLAWDWISPSVRLALNTAFPYGSNDGAVWAGRGITTAVQAGLSFRAGPLSLVLAPIAFRAENSAFDLAPNGETGDLVFADWSRPQIIDLPQRFGAGPYMRLGPGQSTLRFDYRGIAAGVSTANQHWGPASQHPPLLGNNAAGFLHGFIGTSSPLNVLVGRTHGRVVWGLLIISQSEYSPVEGQISRRFMSGLAAVFAPRGLDGLEIGGARFFHTPWPVDGPGTGEFLKPFEGFLKSGLRQTGVGSDGLSDAEN